jgi:hypothetical protein
MPQLARDLTTRVQFLMATSELSLFEEVKEKFSPELLWGEGGCLANMRFSCVEDTGCAHNSKKRDNDQGHVCMILGATLHLVPVLRPPISIIFFFLFRVSMNYYYPVVLVLLFPNLSATQKQKAKC